MPSALPLAGIDLGSSKTAVSLWTRRGRKLGAALWPTVATPEESLVRVRDELSHLLAESGGGTRLAAVGISAGGPVDSRRGVLLTVPNLPGWSNVALRDQVASIFAAPTAIENDANACALAEWRFGAGRGARTMAFLTCSTGIGAGLVIDGKLYRGTRDLAGEIGHFPIVPDGEPCGCGQRGCLEAYASGAGMARRLAALRRDRPELPASAKEATARAKAGDVWAQGFLAETARFLAHGIAALVCILDPERIVLGTIAVGAGEWLLEPLRQELRRLVWPRLLEGLAVSPAALGADLGDHAALAVAREALRPASGRRGAAS